jgi:hypothetical protein
MRELVAVELFKLRSVRSSWWLAAAALGLVVLGTILTLAFAAKPHSERELRSLLSFVGTAGLPMLVFGAVTMGGEYRHRTIVSALLVRPERNELLLAKALAATVAGAIIGLAAAVLTSLIALPWLAASGVHLSLSVGQILVLNLGAVTYCALSALLGVGLAAVVGDQVAAVAGVLVVIAVVDPALSAVLPSLGKFGPSALGISLSGSASNTGGPYTEVLGAGWAALVYLAYATAFMIAAFFANDRREFA